ncbi:MAG: phosphoglycerate dehydrogenase [Bacteroidota bacterium]
MLASSTDPTTSLGKDKIRVVLLEGIHDSAADTFEAAGYATIERRSGAVQGDEMAELLQGVHFLGIRSRTKVTPKILKRADRLVGIGCFCIGTDQVALDVAAQQGVAVFNAPYSNTRSVAELVLAEAILLLRGIPEKNALAHRGVWAKSAVQSNEARGKTLGVVGYGNIGAQLSVLAEALGMRVLFYDVMARLPLGNAQAASSLGDLLRESDVVTLHVPDSPQTRGLIGASELAMMKSGAVLLNASRGSVVDLDALAEALRSEHLRGAAVDVFPKEPKSKTEAFSSPLQGIDRALLTPHVGGSTEEAQANIGREVAGKLVRYSDNGSTESSVNLPEVSLPEHPNCHRFLHIHENVPGVLSAINRVVSEAGANVVGQYLQTRGALGYVVTDVDDEGAPASEALLSALRDVSGTIRTRVLF